MLLGAGRKHLQKMWSIKSRLFAGEYERAVIDVKIEGHAGDIAGCEVPQQRGKCVAEWAMSVCKLKRVPAGQAVPHAPVRCA